MLKGKNMVLWIIVILIFIFLIFSFPKQLLKIFLGFIGIIIIIYIFYELNRSNKKSIHDKITISIKYDVKHCSEEYPLFVHITNNSNKVIHEISWSFAVYKPGFSNDIINKNQSVHSDIYKILRPREQYNLCKKVPKFEDHYPPQNAIYEVTYKHLKLDNDKNIYNSDVQ